MSSESESETFITKPLESAKHVKVDVEKNQNENFPDKIRSILKSKKTIEWKNRIDDLNNKVDLNSYVILSRKKFSSILKLHNFLREAPAQSETEFLWVIFLWISNKLEFDVEKIGDGKKYNDKNIEKLLSVGKMNGLGYCKIFKKLCDLSNIKCILIKGYGKGYGYKVLRKFEATNHVWIAVKINDEWKLIDVAWASGYCSSDFNEFVKEFQPYYFFTPPEIFKYQHYSENYQLQEDKLNLEEFIQLPQLRLEYFLYGVNMSNHDSVILMNKNPFLVLFEAFNNIQISADLYDRTERLIENCCFIQRNYITLKHEISISVPRANNYCLRGICNK
jgi:hypothetical protein